MGRGISLVKGGVGKEAEDTEVAGSEDTELQVSRDPGQGRRAPAEGQEVPDTSLPASRSYTVKKRKQGDHRKGVGWGIPVLSAQPPSLPTLRGWI